MRPDDDAPRYPTRDKYILDAQHNVIPADDLLTWGKWLEDRAHTCVAYTLIGARFEVSTIFMGIPDVRSQLLGGPPRGLFETVAFTLKEDSQRDEIAEQERCDTWEQALAQHTRILTKVAQQPAAAEPAK